MSEVGNKTGILYVDDTSWLLFAYVLAGAFIIYIAWCSTHVRHDNRGNLYRQRTVFIFNPQTGDFQQQHSIGLSLNDLNAHWHAPPPTLESILDEVNGITSGATYHIQRQDDTFDADLMEEETQEIIREMDRDPSDANVAMMNGDSLLADGIRHRRPNEVRDERVDEHMAAAATPTTSTAATQHRMQTTSNNIDDEPHIYPVIDELPPTAPATSSVADSNDQIDGARVEIIERTPPTASGSDRNAIFGDELTIKLKYLNDDLKIVKARPNEAIGDFKKRNFSEELSAQKLVRLVFNGHVLQPDSKTITACGLFDNCVVHCLIHNPRPNAVPPPNQTIDNNQLTPTINEDGNEQIGIENLINANRNRNRNTQRLLNLSLFLICLSVIISWFFRIQYFQLFTWYSTVGLVLLTTFFVVIIPLIFLIEREIFRNL